MCEFGVDEAGKGPVLGSMFAAAVVADPDALPDDVGDSKGISPDRRETLDAEIRDVARCVGVAEIPVPRIDADDTDMNSLTVDAHVRALCAAVDGGTSGTGSLDGYDALSGYVDAGDANAVRFERRVIDGMTGNANAGEDDRGVDANVDGTDGVNDTDGVDGIHGVDGVDGIDAVDVDLTAEHGADETYAIVGAASIVAKVARDAHVESLAAEHGDVGSGYPSDPTTREFLRSYVADNDSLPGCARASWKTSRDALAAASQSSLDEF